MQEWVVLLGMTHSCMNNFWINKKPQITYRYLRLILAENSFQI